MKKVLILKGLPASGKSTYAKKLCVDKNYKRINKDDLRAMVDDGRWSGKNEKLIITLRDVLLATLLRLGNNVVIDDTNFEKKHIDNIKEIANTYEAETETMFFDTPVEECIKRDLKRANSVGQDVILRMYSKYLIKKDTPENIESVADAIICDIDGTLATMKNRSPFEWDKVSQDELVEPTFKVINKFKNTVTKIILLSGRDGGCREVTEKWLADKNVEYDFLYMREAGDNRDDRIIKKELYEKHIKNKYNVLFVLDDRPKVVRMWKEFGLFVFDCNQDDSRINF